MFLFMFVPWKPFFCFVFFFQAEDGIRDADVTGVQTCALPILTFGQTFILKHFRRLQDGVNPEAEITRFLTERTTFTHTPRLAGRLEYRAGGAVATLAVLQELVPAARDGWQWMVDRLADFRRAVARQGAAADPSVVGARAGDTLTAL